MGGGGGGGTIDYSVTPGPSFWVYYSDSELWVFTFAEPGLEWDLCGTHVGPVYDLELDNIIFTKVTLVYDDHKKNQLEIFMSKIVWV